MQGLTGCPFTCFPSSVTKAQPASADLGCSCFWCLVAGACAYIPKPCDLHNHKYNFTLEISSTLGPSIGPGSDSGMTIGSASNINAGASQMTTAD